MLLRAAPQNLFDGNNGKEHVEMSDLEKKDREKTK